MGIVGCCNVLFCSSGCCLHQGGSFPVVVSGVCMDGDNAHVLVVVSFKRDFIL